MQTAQQITDGFTALTHTATAVGWAFVTIIMLAVMAWSIHTLVWRESK